MLEYKCYPVFIDAVLGDVRTEFNEKTLKTTLDGWTENMKSAWLQIEKQLIDSPPAKDVAKRLKKKILTSKSGVVYEGGFLHRCIYSYAGKIIPDSLKIKILQKRYFSKR
jgi:hypothetical protein